MKNSRSVIVFIFMILAAMQLDGMLKNNVVRPLARRITLTQRASVGVQNNRLRSRFSGRHQYDEKSSGFADFSKRFSIAGGVVALCSIAGDSFDGLAASVEDRIDGVAYAWHNIMILKGPSELYAQKAIDVMVAQVEGVLLSDGGGRFTNNAYKDLHDHILLHKGAGYAIHPKLLIMLLSIKSQYNYEGRLLLQSAFVKNIEHMRQQELHKIFETLYEKLMKEIQELKNSNNDDEKKESDKKLHLEAVLLQKWVAELVDASYAAGMRLNTDGELIILYHGLRELSVKLKELIAKLNQATIEELGHKLLAFKLS